MPVCSRIANSTGASPPAKIGVIVESAPDDRKRLSPKIAKASTLPETREADLRRKPSEACGSHLFRDGDGRQRQACNEVLRQEAKAIGVDLRRFPDCANTFPVLLFKIPCSSKSNSLFRCAGNLAVTLRICFEIRTRFLL
jgi:hypothetical protein